MSDNPATVASRLRQALTARRIPTASLVRLVPGTPPVIDLGTLRPAAVRQLAYALNQAPTAPDSTASADH